MHTDGPDALPCMCASLRRAGRVITSAYDDALRDTGLRSTQFSLLQSLDGHELTQGALGEILALDSTTLSRSLRPLITAGLIGRVAGSDRRERVLTLTPSGSRRLGEARVAWKRVQRRLHRTLGDAAWKRLHDDLRLAAGVQL